MHFNRSPLFWIILGALWIVSAVLTYIEHQNFTASVLLVIPGIICYVIVAVLVAKDER